MSEPKYTIIVNSYPHPGREKDLLRCLGSLISQTYKNFSILIIENNKDTKNLGKILKKVKTSKKISVVADPVKKLSYLFNIGWKNAKTSLLAYIADDAEADKNWLKKINQELSSSKKIGACSGPIVSVCYPAGEMHRLYLMSQSNIFFKLLAWPYLHYAMEDRVLDPGILLESGAYTLGASLEDSKKYGRQEVDLLTTSSMGIRKSALERIKGFNEKYFFNHADGDLFLRLKNAGYSLIFNPKIIAKHHMSLGPSRNAYYIGRDTGRFYRDHIRPHSLKGYTGAILNVFVLNGYWVTQSIKQQSLKPLVGIYAFIRGFFEV